MSHTEMHSDSFLSVTSERPHHHHHHQGPHTHTPGPAKVS